MKNPNGYGQICKLSGRRRKRYAVRISAGYKERICVPNRSEFYPDIIDKFDMKYRKSKNDYVMYCEDDEVKERFDAAGVPYRIEFVRQYRYLEYFEKSKDAHAYLAQMNRGDPVKEHVSIASEPDFKAVYDMYIQFANSLNKPPSNASLRAYRTGFNAWEDLHDIRFKAVTTQQLQKCLTAHGTLSKSSVTRMITILKKMYKYAIANEICEKDLSPFLFQEHTDEKTYVHVPYSDEEIEKLWKTDTEAAHVTLILIYTGLRCTEFLELKTENIYLDERYLVGGIKTEAGRNRVVPLHKKIIPILREMYNPKNKYLFPNDYGGCMLYSHFRDNKWKPYQKELKMDHYTHDCRHTFSTALEKCGVSDFHRKLIMGHAIRDLTNGVYTHVSLESLIEDIDRWK